MPEISLTPGFVPPPNISYLDDQIGDILRILKATRQAENTIILFCSDHGDMLGERGLWFKMSFLEGSSRVPLMIAAPGLAPGKISEPVSNVDILPTLCDLAGIDMSAIAPWTDGETLVPVAAGAARSKPVTIEYAAEGSHAPLVSIRSGRTSSTIANSTRRNCSTSPPIRMNSTIWPVIPRMPNGLRISWRRSGPNGTWRGLMPMSAKARRGAG